jgi:hypothetical protein
MNIYRKYCPNVFVAQCDQEYQKGLKDGTIKRDHSYSLAYASKKVKDLKGKVEIAKKLWADE